MGFQSLRNRIRLVSLSHPQSEMMARDRQTDPNRGNHVWARERRCAIVPTSQISNYDPQRYPFHLHLLRDYHSLQLDCIHHCSYRRPRNLKLTNSQQLYVGQY